MKLHEIAALIVVFALCVVGALWMRSSAIPEDAAPLDITHPVIAPEAEAPALSVIFAGDAIPGGAPGLEALLGTADAVVANLPVERLEGDVLASLGGPDAAVLTLANDVVIRTEGGRLDALRASLGEAGISTVGAGEDDEAAQEPWRYEEEVAGAPFRLAVFSAVDLGRPLPEEGARVARLDVEALSARLAAEEEDTFAVVALNWGKHHTWASDEQRETAHALVEAGADLVLGTGSHMMCNLERHEGAWIAFGLGDLLHPATKVAKRNKHAVPWSLVLRLAVRPGEAGPEAALTAFPIHPARAGEPARFLELDEIGEAYWALVAADFHVRSKFKAKAPLRVGPIARHWELLPGEVSP